MKNKILTIILTVLLIGASFFGANPGPAEFTVTTTVADKSYMGVTTTAYTTPDANYTAFTNHGVTASGSQTLTAFITSYSNNPAGYSITMSATEMTNQGEGLSTNSPIHYTVGANEKTYNTETSEAAVVVYTSGSLATISGVSYAISIDVDTTSFAAATTGSYTGTITFTYSTL